MSDPVLTHLLANRETFLDRLKTLVTAPSVSADPAYKDGMAETRAILSGWLREAGFDTVQEIEAGGHPAVYGDWLHAPGAPTFIVYGHYDVQPPDPLEKWISPPFKATIREERIYGRGVSDDKGPSLIALQTLFGFLKVEGRLPVNIRVLLEGEEEVGSATLPALCGKHADLLKADAVISADGARWRADLPCVNVGSRGNSGYDIALRTAAKDLHSGRFGGAVRNALHEMAALIASLHTPDGRIAVDGFYDGVSPISGEERAHLEAIPFDEADFVSAIGGSAHGEPGFGTLDRLWNRPTLEINGMWGGYLGEGAKTVTPAEAFAKITTRLVTGQDPARVGQAIEAHLRKACPDGVALEIVENHAGTSAYTVPPDHPLLKATETAMGIAAGKDPLRIRIGGTLPLTDILKRELGIDTVMLSYSTTDEDFHAPNEFFRLSAIDEGQTAWVALLRDLGTQSPELYAPYRP